MKKSYAEHSYALSLPHYTKYLWYIEKQGNGKNLACTCCQFDKLPDNVPFKYPKSKQYLKKLESL